jgi:hypothetical protein
VHIEQYLRMIIFILLLKSRIKKNKSNKLRNNRLNNLHIKIQMGIIKKYKL